MTELEAAWKSADPLSEADYELMGRPAGASNYRDAIYRLVSVVRPRSVIEIGLNIGHSARAIIMALEKIGVPAVMVDIDVDDQEGLQSVLAMPKSAVEWHFIGGQSQVVVKEVLDIVPHADLLYIDGDHESEGVRTDWKLYSPHANVILLDDIDLDGPGTVWRNIDRRKFEMFSYHVETTHWAGVAARRNRM